MENCPAFLLESLQPCPDIPYRCLQDSAQNPEDHSGLEGRKACVVGWVPAFSAHTHLCTLRYDGGNVRIGGLSLMLGGKHTQNHSL